MAMLDVVVSNFRKMSATIKIADPSIALAIPTGDSSC
jgi:hypothetical protein